MEPAWRSSCQPFPAGATANLHDQPEAVLYFEVPNAHLILRERSIWDVIYEHTSYFVPDSLEYAFKACGFSVLDVHECYSDQFAAVEARIDPSWDGTRKSEQVAGERDLSLLVERFSHEFASMRETWNRRFREFGEQRRKVALWGGGAKAVSFVSLIEDDGLVEYVVDINPGKQGTFLGGGGQKIVGPAGLRSAPVDVVIVLNPVYLEEVREMIGEMGLSPELMTV